MPRKKVKNWPSEMKIDAGSFCDVGRLVEVAGQDENYRGSWYEAQVVRLLPPPPDPRRKTEKGASFLVQFTRLGLEPGSSPLTEPVPFELIRPLPPAFGFPIEPHDVVDTFLENGWWEGVVVRVLEGSKSKRFCVFFENKKDPSDRVKEFDRSALRHHLDWVGGQWVRCPKNLDIACSTDEQRQNQSVISPDSIKPSGSCVSAENTVVDVNSFERELEHSAQMIEVALTMISTSNYLATSSGSEQPITIIPHGKERRTNVLALEAYSLKGSQNALREKVLEATCDSSNPFCPSSHFEQNLPNIIKNPWTLLPRNETVETLASQADIRRINLPIETDSQRLPFAKVSQVWKQIESMETFRKFPQNPHFHPLEQFEEFSREGMAIGCMIMFDKIVEEWSKLEVDDPRSKIDGMVNGLLHLENHGFNVNTIRSCLTKLRERKDEREKLLLEKEESERKIIEHKDIMKKTDEELEAAVEEQKKLERKIARLVSEIKSKVDVLGRSMSKKAELEAIEDVINRSMLENTILIEKIVAALRSGSRPDKN